MAAERRLRVLAVATHVVQYASPLLRRYAADPRLDLTVAYCSLQGAEIGRDPDFGIDIAWDVPLLNGYRWVALRNISPSPGLSAFFGLVNPQLWTLVRRGQFDVIVCYGYNRASFWIAAVAAKTAGIPFLFTTDGHTWESRKGTNLKLWLKKLAVPRIFKFATGVLVPSTRTRAFVRSLGIPDDRVFLTPYVVDNDFFVSAAASVDRKAVRASWGIPDDAVVALFVGKLVDWKRPLDFVKAVSQVDNIHGVIVGDGILRDRVAATVERCGLANRVRLMGFLNQTELARAYAGADVLVLPSSREAFGLVVNEAFASGCPAIVSDACGAAGDLVRDGETGFVFPAGDIAALADRLRRVAECPRLRDSMRQKCMGRINKWGPDENVNAFVEACWRIATKARSRRPLA